MPSEQEFIDLNSAIKIENTKNAYNFGNGIVFIKPCEDFEEVIAEEVATVLGVETLHYDIGVRNKELYVFSKPFYAENEEYISGVDILSQAYPNEISLGVNNLTNIWGALEKLYGTEYANDIPQIIENLVRIFCFDLLVSNNDRVNVNWGVIRNESGMRLAPMFDNSLIFNFFPAVGLGVDSERAYNNKKILSNFLSVSDSYFTDIFYEMFDTLTPDKLDSIFKDVEKDRNITIDENYRVETVNNFNNYRNGLQEVVEQYRQGKRL